MKVLQPEMLWLSGYPKRQTEDFILHSSFSSLVIKLVTRAGGEQNRSGRGKTEISFAPEEIQESIREVINNKTKPETRSLQKVEYHRLCPVSQ